MSRFHTIVAALDFSDSAGDALDGAIALAAADAASRIHVLHVVPSPAPALWSDDLPPMDLHAVEQARIDAALSQLAVLAAGRPFDPSRLTTAVAVGAPANEIVRYAEEHGVDAIVLGSHGHGLVRRLMLGSVAYKVVREAPCAVLVVPPRTLRGTATPSAASLPALE
jgi:nucleotide-binding universal stress UspA family protein